MEIHHGQQSPNIISTPPALKVGSYLLAIHSYNTLASYIYSRLLLQASITHNRLKKLLQTDSTQYLKLDLWSMAFIIQLFNFIGYDMNIFPKGETALKVKPTDSTMSEGFDNLLVLEETMIDEKLQDNDRVKNEGIEVEEHEKQAKESAEKETNHHKDVNLASEGTIVKATIEMIANGSQEDFEGDSKVLSKGSSDEAENMSMEGSSTINPDASNHKALNLNREDSKAEGTKIKPLESKVENVDGNAEVIESNGSSALY